MFRKVFGIFLLFWFLSTLKAQVSFTLSNTYCSGGSLNLTASTTLSPVSYTWSAVPNSVNITSLNSAATSIVFNGTGTYTVLLNYNSGALSGTYQNTTMVTQAIPLNISTSQSSGTTCIINNNPKFSKPVVLSAFGANSYSWTPYDPFTMTYPIGGQHLVTVRPQVSTCYTVIGTSNAACTGSSIACVTVTPQFTFNVVPNSPTICVGDSIQLMAVNIGPSAIGPSSAYTYSWTTPNGFVALSSNLTQTVLAFPHATSILITEVADAANCISFPVTTTVNVGNCVVSLVENELSGFNPILFPNPMNEEVFIETTGIHYDKIVLFNAMGQELFAPIIKLDGRIRVDLSVLKEGMYTIRLMFNNKFVYSSKFVKTNN